MPGWWCWAVVMVIMTPAQVMMRKGFKEISDQAKWAKESQKAPPSRNRHCHHHHHEQYHLHHHHIGYIWLLTVSLCLFILASPPYLSPPHKHVYLVIQYSIMMRRRKWWQSIFLSFQNCTVCSMCASQRSSLGNQMEISFNTGGCQNAKSYFIAK